MPGASDTCQALGGVETSMVKHVIMSPIPLSRPPVDDQIKQAVLAAIDSRQYILGPQCRQLEAELASATGVKHAVLTSSDRKSTRLNSSHGYISYAVFCLKKKKKTITNSDQPTQ